MSRVPVKKDLNGKGLAHPAVYSTRVLNIFDEVMTEHFGLDPASWRTHKTVWDPFAGTGKIHELRPRWVTHGTELEKEWAALNSWTTVGDACTLQHETMFDAVATSPVFGNRLSDHHNASDPHKRRSYTFDLGRTLSNNNSGVLQWGEEYRSFHEKAWKNIVNQIKPGGVFVLNMKDHIRNGEHQPVTKWHVDHIEKKEEMSCIKWVPVGKRALHAGANAKLRKANTEWVIVFERHQ